MKVQNMTSANGNKVANQFIIQDAKMTIPDPERPNQVYEQAYGEAFQSYDTLIAFKAVGVAGRWSATVYLDRDKWDYSRTTSKYRNQFLGETTKETQAKIDSGEYILADLNV